ncbi:hypothetical protein EDC62_2006 [Tibeticola sediminis]|uniref:SET domain-containing protein n=1 Tax=Tibeticola sediminis TaxID=1917811 RepID=A0A3N4U8Y8_9BURK|nr:hypothetical protein EDC62_2006 [Tibeticola sediminis]
MRARTCAFFNIPNFSAVARASAPNPKDPPQRGPRRRIVVRASGIHGKGVYAAVDLPAGTDILEYRGELISWEEAQARHPHDPADPNHTFFFHIDDAHVIDGGRGGNAARWINHSCEPNCEAETRGTRVFIKALRDIAAGEELHYDYGLVIDARYTPALKAAFACRCGAPQCRGTMLAPKKRRRSAPDRAGLARGEVSPPGSAS